jgi:hypothetical protein
MWLSLIKLLLPIIIEIIGNLEHDPDCPDGVCAAAKAKVVALQERLDQPTTASFGDFLKCLDFQRFFAAVTEIVDVIRDAMSGCAPIDETQDK